jgi:predicted nucleic acid-binding protein
LAKNRKPKCKEYILDIENDQNPFDDKKNAISEWKKFAVVDIEESAILLERANIFVASGIKAKDALHVAAAIEGKADVFITTDDRLIKKLMGISDIRAVNPVDIVGEIDERNDGH